MRSMTMSTVGTTTAVRTSSRVLNVGLWILQALLAALFLWHGQFMVFPPADMVAMINANMGEGLRIFIGVAEILAAAVGKSVGRPTSIDEDFRVYQPHPVYANGHPQNLSVMPTFPASITRYPFMGGQLTFHASVSVTYHLQ